MQRLFYCIAQCLLFVAIAAPSFGKHIEKRQYIPQRVFAAPLIDGVIGDAEWETADWESDFVQHEPHNGQPESQKTHFAILYDDNFIYVAFKAFDTSPDSIISRRSRRDHADGDYVGVAFDSYYDLRTAFIFGVTAGGTRFENIMTNNGENQDASWDPNWWAQTSINESGWEAEMRIPLSQLRFKKNGNGQWGLEVIRYIQRHKEQTFWQHIPADAPGMVHMFGEIQGLDELKPRTLFDVTPYLVSCAEAYPSQEGNPFASGQERNLKAGLDAKIGLTNDFTLDLTINPDFGQVEADPSEVNLSAFETFYQEKRPFFIEGRNISNFSLGLGDGGIGFDNLFYSRRIGRRPAGQIDENDQEWVSKPSYTNILGAAKMTGKTQNGLSVALIETLAGEANADIDLNGQRSTRLLEPLTNFFVGRVQKDFNNGNHILGGMITSTHRSLDKNLSKQMHQRAYTGGVDYSHYFANKTWLLNINTAMSHVVGSQQSIVKTQRSSARYFQRPDASHLSLDSTRTSLTGTGGKLVVSKTGSGHWNMLGAVLWKSPQFEINDLGYMREADHIIQLLWAQYRQWIPGSFYNNYRIGGNLYNTNDFSGKFIGTGLNLHTSIQYRNFYRSNAGIDYNFNMYSSTLLRGGPSFKRPDQVYLWLGTTSDDRKKLILSLSGNMNFGMEDNSQRISISSPITYKPTDYFNFTFSPSISHSFDELQYVGQFSHSESTRYVFGRITQHQVNFSFRINYTITPDLTIQYWGQPFVASGEFREFKYITNSKHSEYNQRFEKYTTQQISFYEDRYHVSENGDDNPDYSFDRPDFTVREFLSNLVVRWEFNPGSALYLVWSQTRSAYDEQVGMHYVKDLDHMFTQKPHNTLLLKFSYRIGINN